MDASKVRVLQTKRKRAPSTNGDDECADGACESESAAQRANVHKTGHPGLDALEVVERYAPGKMPPSRAAPHAEPAKKQLAVPVSMTRRVGLRFVLESNPKLTALAEVLAEVDPLIAAPGGAPSAKPGCSVLVAARDDRTAYHLRNVLSQGVDALLQVRDMSEALEECIGACLQCIVF